MACARLARRAALGAVSDAKPRESGHFLFGVKALSDDRFSAIKWRKTGGLLTLRAKFSSSTLCRAGAARPRAARQTPEMVFASRIYPGFLQDGLCS